MTPVAPRPFWLAPAAACLALAIAAPAEAADRAIGITSFERVRVEGDHGVELVAGPRITARANGSADALDTLSIEVRDRTLVITRRAQGRWGDGRGVQQPATVRITTPTVKDASLIGGGSLRVEGFAGAELGLRLTGPGRLETQGIDIDRLTVAQSGSGSVSLAGKARDFTARIDGAGTFDARGLPVGNATIVSRGAASSRFTATRSARIDAQGVGKVEVDGDAPCTLVGAGGGVGSGRGSGTSTGIVHCAHGPPLPAR